MKNQSRIILLFCVFGLFFASCKEKEKDEPTGDGKPTIENLAVTPTSSVKYGDVVSISAKFEDETALSAYDVEISNAQGVLFQETKPLTGKTFNLSASQVIPLPKNAQAGNVTVKLTLKNNGNQTATESVTLSGVAVPNFDALYLDIGGMKPMVKIDGEFVLEDLIAANAAGKIYAKQDKSGMFWGWAGGKVEGLAEGNIPIGKNEATTLIVSFNLTTFDLTIEEGNPWKPIDEAIYIFGTISGHWQDHNNFPDSDGGINVEQNKMKMTGYASGDAKYWTWEPPDGGDDSAEDGMWGNMNPGDFRFKIGGKNEYILFDGDKIITSATDDYSNKSFKISTGGHVIFTLFYDGTQYHKLTLEVSDKSLEYTNDGFIVNGLPLPAAMSFGGGSLTKKEGTFWEYEGLVDLEKDQDITATGVDLSKAKPDRDVFMGASSTWKMIGTSGEWLIRVDPFVYSIYACKTSEYPDAIYLDSWGWSKHEGDPSNNWNPDTRLCLQRVDETKFVYEATFYHHSWGDKAGWGPSMRLFATMPTDPEVIISQEHFVDIEKFDDTAMFMPLTSGGNGSPAYMKVRVDLKDGFDLENDEPVGDKFTITFTELD